MSGTTLILDDGLMETAMRLMGLQSKTAVVRAALGLLVSRESGRRLAAPGGTMPKLKADFQAPPATRQLAEVLSHPFVIGELACGSLEVRAETLRRLERLPAVHAAEHREVRTLVEARGLMGRASALIARVALWTLDRVLREAAQDLGVSAEPERPRRGAGHRAAGTD